MSTTHRSPSHRLDDRGIAMITVLLVLMLMSALLVGFTTVVMSDQRYRFIDRDRGQAFYAASGGIEKLTADLGNLFLSNVAPTGAQVTALTAASAKPVIAGITYTAVNPPQALPASLLTSYYCAGNKTVNGIFYPARTPTTVGGNGYTITYCAMNSTGNPATSDMPLPIKWGPYEGLVALQTPYQFDVTAQTSTGGEVHLSRTVEAVAIPVFQFGMFSDVDLSFYAGTFNFGGRTHTNGNLWLASGGGATLTMTGKITAVGQVVRSYMQNGVPIATSGFTGTVSLATQGNAPTGNRNLLSTEGSVTGMPGSAPYANWNTLSTGAAPPNYNGYIRTGSTGAKVLKLPLVTSTVGGTNIDLIRRPAAGEDTTSILYNERLYTKASLRILLSDTAADITNLPGVSAGAPIQLEGDWKAAPPFVGYAAQPIARSMGNTGTLATTTAATTRAANQNISVNAMPAIFQNPQIWLKNAAGANIVGPITCTGRTLTSFSGCTHAAVTVANQPIIYVANAASPATAIAGNMPGDGGANAYTPTATLGANSALNADITLAAGQTTLGFAANSFYLNDVGAGGTGVSTPVTCGGYSGTQFQLCNGVAATVTGATVTTGYATPADTATIGGYLKVERGNADGTYTDVTQEFLSYGIGAPDPGPRDGLASPCADPSPNAIIRIQRLRDTAGAAAAPANCSVVDTTNSYEYIPQALFDTRESVQRDADPGTFANNAASGLPLGGVMYYIALDVQNLARWFRASQAPYNVLNSGLLAKIDNTGQTVYFSDRRNNRNAASVETGEYGWEDIVNPGNATGAPNGALDTGEDFNGNGTVEVYGGVPNYNGVYNSVVAGSVAPLDTTATPRTLVKRGVAQVNRPILFRRALKLINGGNIGSSAVAAERLTGLTIVSENPVYVHGNYNAAATFLANDLHAATAIIADSVTMLTNNWNDNDGFYQPYFYGVYASAFGAAGGGMGRLRQAQVYYRVAILGGKGPAFLKPADVAMAGSLLGTDGGAHNFLRLLEQDNGAATTINYRGSLATLAYSRQGLGTFKCCSGQPSDGIVYSTPTRNFIFDTDFLNPALLPPNTPVFRDMNAVGFSQELRPGR